MRWISTFGNLFSAGAGVALARTLTGQDNPLEAVRESLRPAAWGLAPATEGNRGTLAEPSRQRHEERAAVLSLFRT